MNDQEVSAFASYTKKVSKKVNSGKSLGLGIKSKIKLKKKKVASTNKIKCFQKPPGNSQDSENLNSLNKKDISKSTNQKKIMKSLLMNQAESVFDECNSKVKLNGNTFEENKSRNDKADKIDSGAKKTKKIKVLNGEVSQNFTASEAVEVKETESTKSKKRKLDELESEEFNSPSLIYGDSVKMGEELLAWMLSPVEVKNFFNDCWEKKPLHIKRKNKDFFKCICTFKDFRTALRENDVYFTKNIDVTSYIDGKKYTENLEGKATVPVVWDFFNQGKSIRMLNPQTFIPNVRLLNSTLQEFFQCFVGANIYLTPAGTQGFAPHYDDIEAFVLQLEGEKQWKLYSPRSPEEILPRYSSENFNEDEIGEPILEVTLEAGDLLYFPRGFIHQAKCSSVAHSLHITVSCYQKNSWADLFEKLLPVALERAILEDVELRKGLPIGYLNHVGMIFSDQNTEIRRQMMQKFKELAQRIFKFCPLDAGADQMAADFIHDALPPCLAEEEKLHGADRNAKYKNKSFFAALKNISNKNLGVKLIRATSVRLVSEGDELFLHYSTDNSLVYHENEASSVRIPLFWTLAIEHLVRTYPNFTEMKSLPVLKKGEKLGKWSRIAKFVYFLWQRGLILFDKPHRALYS